MPDNFFAQLTDNIVKRISLLQNIESGIRDIFINGGPRLMFGRAEEEFDGNFQIAEDEIYFVTMELPEALTTAVSHPLETENLDVANDEIKSVFWYEEETYYFQNFDKRKLLRNKSVLFFSQESFNRLEQDAFILDDSVNAMYNDGKLYFISYANANKIVPLVAFFREATKEELETFTAHGSLHFEDPAWFAALPNTVIRRQVTMLSNSGLLDIATPKKIKKIAATCNVDIELDGDKIVFPKDSVACRDIMYCLNEQIYPGMFSGKIFRTNSKKEFVKK